MKADGDGGSPFAGAWMGVIDGHAAFEADWETTPYCTGSISAEVSSVGRLAGTGDCTIGWGPYTGDVFDVTLTGDVADGGDSALLATLDDAEDEHAWDDSTLTGTGDSAQHTITVEGDTLYHPVGMDPIDGRLRLTLQ